MPTYEYQCPKCGKITERFRHMNARRKVVACDKCKCNCKLLIGKGGGIIFKGSGFYVNDYKRRGGSPTRPHEQEGKK